MKIISIFLLFLFFLQRIKLYLLEFICWYAKNTTWEQRICIPYATDLVRNPCPLQKVEHGYLSFCFLFFCLCFKIDININNKQQK